MLTRIRNLLTSTKRQSSELRRIRRRQCLSPAVDVLEDRTLLATFVVNSPFDNVDETDGATTLREAIIGANASIGHDTILFNIFGGGPATITLNSPLPVLHDSFITIDGRSQPGWTSLGGTPLIEINGQNLPVGHAGIWITGHSASIYALAVNRANGVGIFLSAGANHAIISQNHVGTDRTGNVDLGNLYQGIYMASGSNRVLGNLISGNEANGIWLAHSQSVGNLIEGNRIGVNSTATFGISNGINGILVHDGARANIIRNNVISDNGNTGIWVIDADFNNIEINRIGTDGSGNFDLGNASTGVRISNGATGNHVFGNVISGNGGPGLSLADSTARANIIEANTIGLGADGQTIIGNSGDGVRVAGENNVIGGETEGFGNVISGNHVYGIRLEGANNVIQGNYIGTDRTETLFRGNAGHGISLHFDANSNRIEDNTIAGNGIHGIQAESTTTGNSIRTNRIHSNGGLGIDLNGEGVTANDELDGDAGANSSQNFPLLLGVQSGSSTRVNGLLNSAPNSTYAVEFYASANVDLSGFGEGQKYLGRTTVTTDGAGSAAFDVVLPTSTNPADFITATATGPNGTSEFSAAIPANLISGKYVVTTLADSGYGSLRQAILVANANPGPDEITFNVTGGIGFAINLLSPLPALEDAYTTIDATTQPGYSGTPMFEINGQHLPVGQAAVWITGHHNTIRGLAVNRANGVGIFLSPGADFTQIDHNHIGTDFSGNVDRGNLYQGVFMNSSFNRLEDNVISGNQANGVWIHGSGGREGQGNVIQRNQIGTNVSGSFAVGNGINGIFVSDGAASNIIRENTLSGNGNNGAWLLGAGVTDNRVQSNYMGTNATGSFAIPNASDGIRVSGGAHQNFVGTDIDGVNDDQEGNVISGNRNHGLAMFSSPSHNIIAGNMIGTNAAGTAAIANVSMGIWMSSGSSYNRIGGTNTDERNVISGNGANGINIRASDSQNNHILGNSIGTNAAGTAAIPNSNGIILEAGASNNTIGGLTNTPGTGQGNVISGNVERGIRVNAGDFNTILGNIIGLNAPGDAAIGNAFQGVEIKLGVGNVIGGPALGSRNIISGNLGGFGGVLISGASETIVQGNYIGTDITGINALGNSGGGIQIVGGERNIIGGSEPSAGNVIAGNGQNGLLLRSTKNELNDGFETERDFQSVEFPSGIWSGLITGSATNVTATEASGTLELSSANGRWEGDGTGLFLYREIPADADFSMQVELVDGDFSTFGNPVTFFNSAGLLARVHRSPQDNVVLYHFDAFGAPQTWTSNNDGGESEQSPVGSSSYRWFQLEKSGAWFTARGSIDGVSFHDIGVPVFRPDMAGVPLQVGISQASFSSDIGSATFDNFSLEVSTPFFGVAAESRYNIVQGNRIGTNASGTAALANSNAGVLISDGAEGNVIGGPTRESGNLISGNGTDGIQVSGSGTNHNLIANNYVGTDAAGLLAISNGANGVQLSSGAAENRIGSLAGPIVVEAENFSANIPGANSQWTIVPPGDSPTHSNFRGDGFIQILPDSLGFNGDPIGGNAPRVQYKINVEVPGAYQLFVRAEGFSGTADSFYSQIIELLDGIGGRHADWYRWNVGGDADFATNPWLSQASPETTAFSGADGPAIWFFDTPGEYTAEFIMREDGVALDAFVLQPVYLAAPENDGPEESPTNQAGAFVELPTVSTAGNLISGNGQNGVLINGIGTNNNHLSGNFIGTDTTGMSVIPNTLDGVSIHNGAAGNLIGSDGDGIDDLSEVNMIMNNLRNGIAVQGLDAVGNVIRGNVIHTNGQLGIDLGNDGITKNDPHDFDSGPNALQNFPELKAVRGGTETRIVGSIDSTPLTTLTLDFYANAVADPSGFGEGERYLGSTIVITDEHGHVDFNVTLNIATTGGEFVTATATDSSKNTSEFSGATVVTGFRPNPNDPPGPPDFVTGGGPRNDRIELSPGSIVVTVNGVDLGHFELLGQILVFGLNGDDELIVDAGIGQSVQLFGGPGDDLIQGGDGSDRLHGGPGNDVLLGGDGNDLLAGDEGDDHLDGQIGSDVIDGGSGSNTIISDGLDDLGEFRLSILTPISLTPGSNAVRGQKLDFLADFPDEQSNISWAFGDNSTEAGATAAHAYTNEGLYITTVTITDTVGQTTQILRELSITVIAIQQSYHDTALTMLAVGGTAENDVVLFKPGAQMGEIEAWLNGNLLGAFLPTGGLSAFGQAGNDDLEVAGGLHLRTTLLGGFGDDRLKGGSGHDILLGEDGDDLLVGSSGRDLLIGGRGSDRIVGNADDDILIAGWLQVDDRKQILAHVMEDWTGASSYQQRIESLNNLLVLDRTVQDDPLDEDKLTGSSGEDWFFFDTENDRATDLKDEVFANDLNWILNL